MACTHRGEDIYRFIYFNHMNLALKTSLKQKGAAITNDTMVVLNQMHYDFERSAENITDVMVRTTNDRWIVGKKTDQREVFVIFEDKKQPLLEIQGL
jgi:Flp pilus assembly secretin CpaC